MNVNKWYNRNVMGYMDPATAAVAVGGMGLVGNIMGQDSARSAANAQANATRDAAGVSSDAQIRAAQIAADASKFKPYNLTTGFGTSNMTDTGGTYTLNPQLAAYQAQMYNGANATMPTSFDTSALARDYYQKQQDILAPERERAYSNLQTGLFNTGRGGLAVGATGARPYSGDAGLMATNPELAAYYNSIAQQDLGLQQSAEQYATSKLNSDIARSQGLFSYGTGIEQLGMETLTNSANIGNRISAQNASAAQLLSNATAAGATAQQNAATQAAALTARANSASPLGTAFTTAAGMDWSKIFGTNNSSANGTDLGGGVVINSVSTPSGSQYAW